MENGSKLGSETALKKADSTHLVHVGQCSLIHIVDLFIFDVIYWQRFELAATQLEIIVPELVTGDKKQVEWVNESLR